MAEKENVVNSKELDLNTSDLNNLEIINEGVPSEEHAEKEDVVNSKKQKNVDHNASDLNDFEISNEGVPSEEHVVMKRSNTEGLDEESDSEESESESDSDKEDKEDRDRRRYVNRVIGAMLSDPYLDPLMVTRCPSLLCPAPPYKTWRKAVSDCYGYWLVFRHYEKLNATWRVIREEVKSGSIGGIGVSCHTRMYVPSQTGAGPNTTGVICVCAKEDDYIAVGMRLIKLSAIQHDIRFKSVKASEDGLYTHIPGIRKVTCMNVFWNNGDPYASREPQGPRCPPEKTTYNPSRDIWNINVVNGVPKCEAKAVYGKWIIDFNYKEFDMTELWHDLKFDIERGIIPAIKMECPATTDSDNTPQFHIFTAEEDVSTVGQLVISEVERDIVYACSKLGEVNRKVLHWNEGSPGPLQDIESNDSSVVAKHDSASMKASNVEAERSPSNVHFRNSYDPHDPYQDPLEVTRGFFLKCSGPSAASNSFPPKFNEAVMWQIFRNFEDLNRTWCVVRDAVISGQLGATGAKCTTLKYNPLHCGAGPTTIGKIFVYTKKCDYMGVGMTLIKLDVVQHDIRISKRHADEGLMHIFWNNGDPSVNESCPRCPAPVRDDRRNYDPSTDHWKINVVNGSSCLMSTRIYGKWIIVSNYNHKYEFNVSYLWHTLKGAIESGRIPAIKMECPAPPHRDDNPVILIFTSEDNVTEVGKRVLFILKHNYIVYVRGAGLFQDDRKTLYWNDGNPSFDNSRTQRMWRQ